MKKFCKGLFIPIVLGLVCSLAGVGSSSDQTGKSMIYVLTDRNITEDMDVNTINSRNQLGDWWEGDLSNVLTRRGGYEARQIQKSEEFVAGPDAYLLTAKIASYNPGSKAARILIGFGAGACSMDLHVELFGADNIQIFTKDDHVASSRDWKYVARKLNENILQAVNEALHADEVKS